MKYIDLSIFEKPLLKVPIILIWLDNENHNLSCLACHVILKRPIHILRQHNFEVSDPPTMSAQLNFSKTKTLQTGPFET